jgi:heme-degrading monooxygenase HmoA
MMISITSSRPTKEQSQELERFLETFLPRMRMFPGVVAIYHFARADQGEESTVTIWEGEEALNRYRESSLVQEAVALEKKLTLHTTREAYPLIRVL